MTNDKKNKRRTKREIWGTAYHEAGHAVVSLVQGLSIKSVTIVPKDDYWGIELSPNVLHYECSGRRKQRQIARACIIGCYAGLQAELIFNPQAEAYRSRGDDSLAFELSRTYGVLPRHCSCIGDELHEEYLSKLRKDARQLVTRHWQAIEAVAKTLLQKRMLTHEQVHQIVYEGLQ